MVRNTNLEKILNGNRWAYTGSTAMKLHANRLGVPFFRTIGNTNIAVNNISTAYRISGNRWRFKNGPPGPKSKHVVLVNGNNKKLNVLKVGGGLAPSSLRNAIIINGAPVASLNSLIARKINSLNNAFDRNNINKIKRNIEFMKLLKSKNKNSPKRKNNNGNNRRRRLREGGGVKLVF